IAIWQGKDRGGRDETFKHHEGVFLGRTPDEPNILHGKIEQGASMLRKVRNESSVEVDKTDEGLDLLFVGRGRPLQHTSYLYWVHFDLVVRDDNTKVFDASLFELALLVSEVQLMTSQPFHNHAGNRPMFFQCRCEDEDVIEVDGDNTLGDEVLEDFVHHCLEGRRAVGQSKVHHKRFEQTAISSKRRFPFIAFFYPHIVIPPADVKLGEVLRAFESVNEVINEREGVAVLPSDQVERAIVLHEAKLSVFLLDEEDGSAYWRFQMLNVSCRQGFFQESVQFSLLSGDK